MLILGLDIATSTGACWMDTALPPSQWRCLALGAEGAFQEEKASDLALFLHAEGEQRRPDFVAIEMPQRSVTRFGKKQVDPETGEETAGSTINPNALKLSALAAAATAAFDILGVPWGLIAVSTWRSAYYGKGVKPGHGDDWKELAIQWADRQGIVLPPTKKAQMDAAEAVGIASSWIKCTQIPERHQRAFMDLRLGHRRAA